MQQAAASVLQIAQHGAIALTNCPTLLTGGGAGIKLGENIVVPNDTPLCNAWLTLLRGVGVKVDRHGDSTGILPEIVA